MKIQNLFFVTICDGQLIYVEKYMRKKIQYFETFQAFANKNVTNCLKMKKSLNFNSEKASQCGYVVSTSAFRQGDPGSNPIAARKSCEVYPGLGILQPQWNPYPTLTLPSC